MVSQMKVIARSTVKLLIVNNSKVKLLKRNIRLRYEWASCICICIFQVTIGKIPMSFQRCLPGYYDLTTTFQMKINNIVFHRFSRHYALFMDYVSGQRGEDFCWQRVCIFPCGLECQRDRHKCIEQI